MISDQPNPLICYVQLGINPSPLLLASAGQAVRGLPNARLKLITDSPQAWEMFPGEIIRLQGKERPNIMKKLESQFPVLASRAGGYWVKTLERLFVLTHAYREESHELPMIHFESDVWSFIDSDILSALIVHCKAVAIPATKLGTGCASLLYAPSLTSLNAALESLTAVLLDSEEWRGDMELLGQGLLSGILQELPTRPNDSWVGRNSSNNSEFNLLFDAMALGQYVCGADPIHTNNRVVSGFQNADFEIPLESMKWSVINLASSLEKSLVVSSDNEDYRIANLHVHSKVSPGDLSDPSSEWARLLDEANGETGRQIGPYTPELIHSQSPTLRSRFRLMAIEGLPATFKRVKNRILGNL